jgi:hypothetical protein
MVTHLKIKIMLIYQQNERNVSAERILSFFLIN